MPELSFLTPSSIATFWDSAFAAWMDQWLGARSRESVLIDPWAQVGGSHRDEHTEESRLFEKRGREHEARVLARLGVSRDVRRIDPHDRESTLAAMHAGAGVIYQASLASEGLVGVADFLVREERPSALGAHSYTIWDAKLAHAPKPEFVLQVCAYVEMLAEVQGVVPARCTIALGQGAEWTFAPNEFLAYYRTVRRSAEAFQERFEPDRPVHPRTCARFGSWSSLAARILEAEDHVSRVANITRSQVRRLEDAGVLTVADLARAAEGGMRGMDPLVHERLRRQAQMQVASRDAERPAFHVRPCRSDDPRRGLALLPPASALDVFFDMEGDPLTTGGYEYLFGACERDGTGITFHDWWAYTTGEERQAFEGFIDWTMERRRRDPAMHIYHYAPYEVTAVRRLSTRYGTREAEVDDLLRNHVFVDLFQVVRQGLIVGSAGYSLKDIERLYLTRTGDITSAGGSVVAFHRWRDAPDGGTCEDSATLRSIRDYNESDCASLVHLVDWLRGVQADAGIAWCPPPAKEETEDEDAPSSARAAARAALLEELTRRAGDESAPAEERRIDQLLAWLVNFHWREMKPVYWEMYAKQERGEDEHYDDPDCLVCDRTPTPPRPIDRSLLYEYAFDPDQNTILDPGMTCDFVHDLKHAGEIVELDRDEGRLLLKRGVRSGEPPAHAVLFENADVRAGVIEDAIADYARAHLDGRTDSRAVDDLLSRRRPRIAELESGQPLTGNADTPLVERAIDLIRRMQETTLCIQGPPGTGKTYTASHVIAALLADGRRVGVMSNSHKAVTKLLVEVARVARRPTLLKVGKECDSRLAENGIEWIKDGGAAEPRLASLGEAPYVVGGTAWLFARQALAGSLDYLFVDEAGQVSLANIVGAGRAARNIVLIGDQMQLAQPVRGAHPGESGQSALVYVLDGADTIPEDMGLFLDTSWRMHPDVCSFVSEAMYDGRLRAHPRTSTHGVSAGRRPARRVTRSSGILFVESPHSGNTQWSVEEIAVVRDLLADLDHGRVQTDGRPHLVRPKDVLVVAPYNAHVRRLRGSLGGAAEVGTVDKFQGMEAPVVIVSLAASTIEEAPRGAEFLLSRNRINVAVSRAQALAIVVASPELLTAHCTSIEDMRRVNLLCRLHDLGSSATLGSQTPADPAVTLFRSTS